MKESELVYQARFGDKAALGTIIEAYYDDVYQFLARRHGDAFVAQDAGKTDAILLSSKNGRHKTAVAKLIASLIYCAICWAAFIIMTLIISFVFLGAQGATVGGMKDEYRKLFHHYSVYAARLRYPWTYDTCNIVSLFKTGFLNRAVCDFRSAACGLTVSNCE